jgi:sialate O-acetylesterase
MPSPFVLYPTPLAAGEANANVASIEPYKTLSANLIEGWRKDWAQGDFPFLFVQLANFKTLQTAPSPNDNWAWLREAQRLTLNQPATGMATIIDIGDADDIHPLIGEQFLEIRVDRRIRRPA